ncbi:heavy metal-binding domain-containing protein [bacterium]|nr:heavy metal-binding domain-containing protein [bacterium]
MDFLILGVLFLFFSFLGLYSLKQNEIKEREKRFNAINPIIGQPVISTEPHVINKNAIKYSEPVTASVILNQDLKTVLQNRWMHFFKSKKYYEKEIKKASKLAVIKMKYNANHAHLIVNTRVQTSIIHSNNILEPDKICAVAYGTAITYY